MSFERIVGSVNVNYVIMKKHIIKIFYMQEFDNQHGRACRGILSEDALVGEEEALMC